MTRLFLGVLVGAVGLLPAAVPAVPAGTPEPRPSEEEIGSVQVYLTPDQALREVFEGVASVDSVWAVLTEEEAATIREGTQAAVAADSVLILRPRDASGKILGWALIGDEVGKYRPITFLVGVRPDGTVQGVEVLVYRESRGGEVRRGRFLRQYRGKDAEDPIRINRDIINVAGATLSVNALNRGVKGALVTLQLLRKRIDL